MIAIVGAGISGLALAHELSALNVPHVVLEATDRVGGVIRSATVDGHFLEWGPQRTRFVGPVRELIDQLGIRDEVIFAPDDLPLLIYRNGALHSVPPSFAEFASSPLISAGGRIRILAEPFTGAARDDETVARYFTRKVGREIYEAIIGPLYGGLYASDPADMIVGTSLTHVLRDLGVKRSLLLRAASRGGKLNAPSACSFRDGMQTLPNALYERHRDAVRLGTAVRVIAVNADAYRLTTDDGVVDAQHVVLTTPASVSASLLRDVDGNAAERIGGLRYNPLAIVHLHSDAQRDRASIPRGLGYQVAFGESLFTRGVTFNDALFDRRGVYTSYLGGAQHPEVLSWTDEEIGSKAVAEFAAVTGARSSVISVARAAMPAWDRTWNALRDIRPRTGIHFCANWESRPGLPGRLARARRLASELAALTR